MLLRLRSVAHEVEKQAVHGGSRSSKSHGLRALRLRCHGRVSPMASFVGIVQVCATSSVGVGRALVPRALGFVLRSGERGPAGPSRPAVSTAASARDICWSARLGSLTQVIFWRLSRRATCGS